MTGSICAGSFSGDPSTNDRCLKTFIARVMASYGFVSTFVLCTTRACTGLSLSLYGRIKNNFVSLAASLKRKPALANDRQSECIASCERARKALRKVLERKRFFDVFLLNSISQFIIENDGSRLVDISIRVTVKYCDKTLKNSRMHKCKLRNV